MTPRIPELVAIERLAETLATSASFETLAIVEGLPIIAFGFGVADRRTLRRHLPLIELLFHAAASHQAWMPTR